MGIYFILGKNRKQNFRKREIFFTALKSSTFKKLNFSDIVFNMFHDSVSDQLLGFGLRGRTRGRTAGAQRVRPGGVTGRGRGRAAQARVFTAPVIGEFKNVIIS